MSIIYFIRHGQASFGADDYDRLSANGRRQAEATGRYLAARKRVMDDVYTGPMDRQMDTAKIIMAALGTAPDDRLRVFPEFEEYDNEAVFRVYLPGLKTADPDLATLADRMLTDRRAFQKVFQRVMACWVTEKDQVTGCESWTGFRDRIRSGLKRLMAESGRGKNVLLVASGGPLGVVMQMALGFSDQKALEVNWNVWNASISEFFYSRDRLTLSTFNSVAHLDALDDPSLMTYR